MDMPPRQTPGSSARNWLPGWFKACLVALVVLIILKVLQLQVFIEISHDGVPLVTGLTDIETYLIPLGLLLVYILWSWAWKKWFDSRGGEG